MSRQNGLWSLRDLHGRSVRTCVGSQSRRALLIAVAFARTIPSSPSGREGSIMDNLFDEFSKSLAESVPRRESLRRLGAVFAGAVQTRPAIWRIHKKDCRSEEHTSE